MANIRTARRSGLVLRGGRQRREMKWIPQAPIQSAVGSSVATLISLLNAAALTNAPFTIVRVRGLLYIATDQVANTEGQFASWGMTVVTEQASAIGITAIPTPVTEPESDWFVFESVAARVMVASAISMFSAGNAVQIDSKAMRKVDVGQDVVAVVEVPASDISEGVEFTSQFRMLIKLH